MPPPGRAGRLRGKEERFRTHSLSTTTGGISKRTCSIERPCRTGVATSLRVIGHRRQGDASRMATTPNASTLGTRRSRKLSRTGVATSLHGVELGVSVVPFTLSAQSPRGIWVRVRILPRHRPDAFPPQRKLRLREQRPRRILTLGGRTPMPGRKVSRTNMGLGRSKYTNMTRFFLQCCSICLLPLRSHARHGIDSKTFIVNFGVHYWFSAVALLPTTNGTRTDAGLGVRKFGT